MSFASKTLIKKVNPVRKLVLLLLALTLLASACSGGAAIAATVNGTEITVGEVEALRPETPTVARQDFADDLFRLILEEVVRQGGRELGVVEDQAAIDSLYNESVASIEEQGLLGEVLEANGMTEETLRHDIFQQIYFPEVQANILEQEDDLRSLYDQLSVAARSEVCVRHILVATEEEAQQVLDRVEAGEEFSDLAVELSIDTGSGAAGGELGCANADGYVESFANAALDATIGEVTDPVLSQFGYHVLIVDSRREQLFDDLREQLGGQLVNDWFLEVMGGANVVVEEQYGVWQTQPQFGVLAPG
jgi:parvulin-like peptidyl-prolyl isomerase